jgi:hypothetical protein
MARKSGPQTAAAHKQTFAQNLCVDHSHVTGKVRGLLCHSCNVGLGHFKDDPRFTRSATEYLEAALGNDKMSEPQGGLASA